jgi:hypothetical protein
MELEKLNSYKIDESNVLTTIDKKHIDNYKQLITFFETAINNSINEGHANYNSLHSSILQCIRFLDNLIFTYDASLQNIKSNNALIDKIISHNTPIQKQGNEKNNQ